MGVRGRGRGLLNSFAKLSNVNLKYVCDLDPEVRRDLAAMVRMAAGNEQGHAEDQAA